VDGEGEAAPEVWVLDHRDESFTRVGRFVFVSYGRGRWDVCGDGRCVYVLRDIARWWVWS
jgi:hypothetical protein